MALRFAGRIVRTHGTEGRVVLGDCVAGFLGFPAGAVVHIGYSSAFAKPFTVQESAEHGSGRFSLRLQGISSPEAASLLKEMGVFADEELMRERAGSAYFPDEIIGCRVVNRDTGETLGHITDVWDMPANAVWVVDYNGKELPIPVIDDIVKHVNIARKTVSVYVMPGLLEIVDGAPNDEHDDENGDKRDKQK
jgi:16S rRNA processing protein RimM